ncbi:demethylrebeccamycin-D-glucose O-methyltransferase [Silurus meridionalis]|uniref:Methyltransferase type 11 domain-containing protein n=1 Tax=Silurus meridionalis TaxID=175797 RepID=A0A8T0ASB5_SILME
MLSRKLGQQLGRPTQSISGWLISKFLKKHNQILEENAVKLCDIQPNETVLELGHGPGLGLQVAVQLLTGPEGKLLGVDYSKYMHNMATERIQEHIASGKVTLYCCDVAAMPLEDSSVDKVFHCNCYYFWPDLKAAASEIHRAMKPGGLMVATLRLDRIARFASKKVFPDENWRPEAYMEALQSCGFADVRMEERTDKFIAFQAIYGTATK